MEYTEEVIKEADSVVRKYTGNYSIKPRYYGQPNIQGYDIKPKHYELAIQDRQSVLEEVKIAITKCDSMAYDYYENRIQSLTQQIEYLQSKI